MRRGVGALLLAVMALALWLVWPIGALPARFAAEDCRRLALIDAETGAAIRGVEDIARHRDALILSAHDRLAAERGAAQTGGLYRLPLAALGATSPVKVARLTGTGRLDPHGIAVAGNRIAVILRRYGAEGHLASDVIVARLEGNRLTAAERLRDPALCAANDLAFAGARLLATLDRRDCPGRSWRDMLFADGGRVVAVGAGGVVATEIDRLAFANGILADSGSAPVVAETRGRRLRVSPARGIDLPGGPDNLTRRADGRVLAALHPDLLRLGLYRHGWIGRAPSRIAAVGLGDGSVEVLMDDPGGALFSAATVAVMAGGRLVAGSVRDAGLMICGAGA